MPKRIQRKRTKGYKMPEGAVYVGRPTKWGNPFRVTGEKDHWFVLNDNDEPVMTFDEKKDALDCCLENYKEYISHEHNLGVLNITELKGIDLTCWCKEGEPCHADVLLEIANS